MSNFFRELIGAKCNFVTTEGEYRSYILKDLSSDWIVIGRDTDEVYLNLRHIISIKISHDDEK